jgi:hypothetical protein
MSKNPANVASNFNGRIRLAFARRPAGSEPNVTVDAPEVLDAPKALEIDVVAYAEDCILSGRLPMAAERLSDLLNDNDEFEFVNVMVEDLLGNAPIETRDVVVHRDELLLVVAPDPRGNARRRNHTSKHPIVARIGPYEVRGLIHALPGADPIDSIRRRKPMIALTDAVIDFSIGTIHHRRDASVVILNRDIVDSIAAGQEAKMAMLDMPVGNPGRLLKDFTGERFG